ncbi:MAG: succinylglutamate desuccinylase/aspartoacylase family protein [Gammaproteobacteria bacterium]
MVDLVIGGQKIKRGERKTFDIPLPSLYTHASVPMTVHVINGRQPGPRLFVCAAVHGDEINGIEIIRRLTQTPALRALKGTLIAVPIVNVYGFVRQSRYLPDRRDLNRVFPGSETGSLAGRLASTFLTEIVDKCSHGIDLHSAAIHRDNLPQIRATFDENGETEALARSFEAPVILNADLRDGSLRAVTAERGIPLLVYEGGEALRFDEMTIRIGLRGIVRVMRKLGMIRPESGKRKRQLPEPVIARSSSWARSSKSGLLRAMVALGAQVKKGDVLGAVSDPFYHTDEEIIAPNSGLIIGKTNLPIVTEGEALFHIARFGKTDDAAEVVEQYQSEFDPMYDNAEMLELPIV